MKDDQQNYMPVVFYFKVLVEGIGGDHEAGFESMSGLDIKIETEAIQEGGGNKFQHRLPPQPKYANLILKRGLLGTSFMAWINEALQNFAFKPKMLTVMLLNEKGEPMVSWAFHNAYPVSVKVSGLTPAENKYAIETLEFAYSYYERTDRK